jgi:CheY-like chemotaxis protein
MRNRAPSKLLPTGLTKWKLSGKGTRVAGFTSNIPDTTRSGRASSFSHRHGRPLEGRFVMLPVPLTLRVLVVDDNRDAADSLTDLLRLCGADARACYSGDEAIAQSAGFDFDAGVLDIHMPGIDGCELASRLRDGAGPRRVLLVALTGVSDDAARQRTAEAGFDLHLTKSSAPEVLVAALVAFERWLAEHRSNG